MEKVAVLMSTYNGEKYLAEQLDSILNQKGVAVELFIRDDGSSDNTLDIIESYVQKDNRVHLKRGTNKGPAESFLDLIYEDRGFDYYALSDQDDIWLDRKIVTAVNKLKNHDNAALYYSALTISDSAGKAVRESIPEVANKDNVKYIFIATGCTIAYNNKMLNLLLKYRPSQIYMHDAWLVMVATYFGSIERDKESYICYRQHGNNVVGMQKKSAMKRIQGFIKRKNLHSGMLKNFLSGYSNSLENSELNELITLTQYRTGLISKIEAVKIALHSSISRESKNSVIRLMLFNKF